MISNKLSTPIKADIIYGFNAVDEIINNRLNIDKIQQDYLVLKNDLVNTYATKTELPNYLPSTAGTSGQILQSTGATSSWIDPNEITVGTANDLANNNHADTAEFTFRQSGCPQDGTA